MGRIGWISAIVILLGLIPLAMTANGEEPEPDAIEVSPNWEGLPEIFEDDDPHYINVTGEGGMFEGYQIEDISLGTYFTQEWSVNLETIIINISVNKIDHQWILTIVPKCDQYGIERVEMRISINGSLEDHSLLIDIKPVNDPPIIEYIYNETQPYRQRSRIRLVPSIIDNDPEDVVDVEVNMEINLSANTPSIDEQLKYYKPEIEKDWNFNLSSGYFYWWINDQEIWRTDEGMMDTTWVIIEFKATDEMGISDSMTINITLEDVNEEPNRPEEIILEFSTVHINEKIQMWVEPVNDPEKDILNYHWSFGDGHEGIGRLVDHTYTKSKSVTIEMWVDDGELLTEKISKNIYVKWEPPPQKERDDDKDGYSNHDDHFDDDPSAHKDSDRDGYPDEWNIGMNEIDSTTGLELDLFPSDPHMNGHDDPDADNDGIVDGHDAFPNDPSASKDTDHDGFPDSWNDNRSEMDSVMDLRIDKYPFDNDRNGYETEDNGHDLFIIFKLGIVLILITIVISFFVFLWVYYNKKRKTP